MKSAAHSRNFGNTQSKKRWNDRNPRKPSNGFNELSFGFNLDYSMSSESLWESASKHTGLELIGAGNRQIQGFEVSCTITLTLTLTQVLFCLGPAPSMAWEAFLLWTRRSFFVNFYVFAIVLLPRKPLGEGACNDTGLEWIGDGNRKIRGFEESCPRSLTLTRALCFFLILPSLHSLRGVVVGEKKFVLFVCLCNSSCQRSSDF